MHILQFIDICFYRKLAINNIYKRITMKKILSLLFVLALILPSCTTKDETKDETLISVQLDGSKMWSLLNVKSGELEFTDEFFAPVSNVVDGAFFVQNEEGTFDLYTIKDTKNKLNRSSYVFVSNFNPNGFAIVRVKDEPWQVINVKGETLATMPKELDILSGFSSEGMALFKDKDNNFGYIDVKGQQVIKPKYKKASLFSDGVAIVAVNIDDDGKVFYNVIDSTGKVLFKFSSAQYSQVSIFNKGYAFAVQGENIILLNKEGKKVTTVGKGSDISNLEVLGDTFIYPDNGFYGLKNMNGEIKIRAKYKTLQYTGEGNLIALNSNDRYGVVTVDDDEVMPFDYNTLMYVAPDRYLTSSGSLIALINAEGKDVSKSAFANVSNRSASANQIALQSILSQWNNIASSITESLSSLSDALNFDIDVPNGDTENVEEVVDGIDSSASISDATYNLKGTVGKYGIEMRIKILSQTDVSGSYWYSKSGSGAAISLYGGMASNGSPMIYLTEECNGKETGSWELEIKEDSNGKTVLTGTMTNYKGQQFPVNLVSR